jgi:hypothetical protein
MRIFCLHQRLRWISFTTALIALGCWMTIEIDRLRRHAGVYRQLASRYAYEERMYKALATQEELYAIQLETTDPTLEITELERRLRITPDGPGYPLSKEGLAIIIQAAKERQASSAAEFRLEATKYLALANHSAIRKQRFEQAAARPWLKPSTEPAMEGSEVFLRQ